MATDSAPEALSPTREANTGPSNAVNEHVVQLTDQTNLLPFKKIIAVFLGLALCVFVSSLDAVMEATVLSNISAAFKAGSVISWVPSAYLLTSTAFQPLYGRLSDIFGRKVCFGTFIRYLFSYYVLLGRLQSVQP